MLLIYFLLKAFYSKSFLLGFRDGSLDKKPKKKRDTKKITTV